MTAAHIKSESSNSSTLPVFCDLNNVTRVAHATGALSVTTTSQQLHASNNDLSAASPTELTSSPF